MTPRAGRGGAVKGRGGDGVIVQQPAPRRGKGAQAKQGTLKMRRGAWQTVAVWAPLAGKVLFAVCVGVALFKSYRAAASSEFFDLRSVDVGGTARASDDQIKQIVRRAAGGGVWRADLNAIASEVERQPWVRSAVVSRVLPSGLRVRVAERVPRAVVRTGAGRFVWVDEDAVMVGSLAPDHQQPAFFLRGWDESGTDAARASNRERVARFLSLAREWEAAGLASRVSEVNLDDLRDVRAQLAGDDSDIEVRLGRGDWTRRLLQAAGALEEHRAAPRGGQITYIDMTQNRRAVLGFKSGAARQAGSVEAASDYPPAAAGVQTVNVVAPAAESNPRPAAAKKSPERTSRADEKKAEKKADKKTEKKAPAEGATDRTAGGAERPRRVGDEDEQNRE